MPSLGSDPAPTLNSVGKRLGGSLESHSVMLHLMQAGHEQHCLPGSESQRRLVGTLEGE